MAKNQCKRKNRRRRSLAARAALLLIGAYRLTLSAFIGRSCRYAPSCSAYMAEAIELHGFWAGGWMGLARLLRCHPLGAHGYDPVPPVAARRAIWYAPWRYGIWRGTYQPDAADAKGGTDDDGHD